MVRETKHLCIANLPQNITEKSLFNAFQCYGKIENIKILDENKHKFASIEFNDVESASKANKSINYLNGSEQQLLTAFHEPGDITSVPKCLIDATNTATSTNSCSFNSNSNNDSEQQQQQAQQTQLSSSFNVNSMNESGQQQLETINVASEQQQLGQNTDNDNLKSQI